MERVDGEEKVGRIRGFFERLARKLPPSTHELIADAYHRAKEFDAQDRERQAARDRRDLYERLVCAALSGSAGRVLRYQNLSAGGVEICEEQAAGLAAAAVSIADAAFELMEEKYS